MAQPDLYLTLFLFGFLGGVGHCLGMCGLLQMALNGENRRSGWGAISFLLSYHGARILVYGFLGAVTASIGSLFGFGFQLNFASGLISLLVGVAVILTGFSFLGLFPWLEVKGSKFLRQALLKVVRGTGKAKGIVLGGINALFPCGLIYSALLLSATAGNAWNGFLGMVFFGLGTVPVLFALGLGVQLFRRLRLRFSLFRLTGAFIILAGFQLILRGLATFGLIPSVTIGNFMLW